MDEKKSKKNAWLRDGALRMKGRMDPPPDDDVSEIAIKKRRFIVVTVFGTVMAFVAFLISISISSGGVIPLTESFKAMI